MSNRMDLLALGGLAVTCTITLADAYMTPPIESTTPPPSKSALLSIPQLKQLDREGFVQIPNAFSRNSILEARAAAIDLYKVSSSRAPTTSVLPKTSIHTYSSLRSFSSPHRSPTKTAPPFGRTRLRSSLTSPQLPSHYAL